MGEVGVRELKQRASEILRRVREEGESFTISHRGKVVARLVPIQAATPQRGETERVWAEMDELAREVSAVWPDGVSAEEAVAEQRR